MISLVVRQNLSQFGCGEGCIPFDFKKVKERGMSMELVRRFWSEQEGQDIAEYAVMLAVILVIVVGTVQLIGSSANNVFSSVASSIQ
jgi:Flp pilus assembly pilin Flp